MDVYEKLFKKLYFLGFPDEYKGFKMIYNFEELQADVDLFPTELKLKVMWSLLK